MQRRTWTLMVGAGACCAAACAAWLAPAREQASNVKGAATMESEQNGVVHLTAESFGTTLAGTDQPVLVDFWASWCPPCRALAPTIDAIAEDAQGKAVIAKLDVDEARDVAREHRIQSIPTLVIFKDGREVDRMVGLQSRGEIERRLAKAAG
ncbi:MAG: thioredoxin [Planctomycetota bacterium]|nr:thioredoxin [Planctomycetota bacterium]